MPVRVLPVRVLPVRLVGALPLLGVLALAGPAGATTPAVSNAVQPTAPADERPRVLLLELERGDVPVTTARTVNALLTTIVSETATDAEILSSTDMRRLMDLEAERETAGCDAQGTSCMTELAAALGAERVIFGSLGQLGGTTIVTLDLFDADAGKPIARASAEVAAMRDLPSALRAAVARLLARTPPAAVRPTQPAAPAPAAAPSRAGPGAWPLVTGGAAAVGGVALLGAAGAAVAIAQPSMDRAGYEMGRTAGLTSLAVGAGATVLGAIAGAMWLTAPPTPKEPAPKEPSPQETP